MYYCSPIVQNIPFWTITSPNKTKDELGLVLTSFLANAQIPTLTTTTSYSPKITIKHQTQHTYSDESLCTSPNAFSESC